MNWARSEVLGARALFVLCQPFISLPGHVDGVSQIVVSLLTNISQQ